MSKYSKSLGGPSNKMHGGQYKAVSVKDATRGRVIIDPKKTISEMSRPSGRTSYLSGCYSASTNVK